MKHALAAMLILAAPLHGAEPGESFPNFMDLSKREAAATARRQAEADFASGRYRILVYGLCRPDSPEDRRLAKEGVQVRAIAGCIVNDGIIEGARVYNEVMRGKLKAKLGRDIFDETSKSESKK